MIDQIYIGEVFRVHFGKTIYDNTKLKPYYDKNKPTFIYGFSTVDSRNIYNNHNGMIIMIWIGGDIITYSKNQFYFKKNVYHLAISNFICKTLNELHLKYVYIPFYPIQEYFFQPSIKGNKIYVYLSGDKNSYGYDFIENVIKKKYKYDIVYTCHKIYHDNTIGTNKLSKYYTHDELINIYKQCFVGIRLTAHDGLAASVQELGAMGIKTIWNGHSPSALNYNTPEDIQNHIENEAKKIGTVDNELPDKVREFLKLNDDFYNEATYLG